MNRKQLFKTLSQNGNKNIVYLTTRTLLPIEKDLRVTIDAARLKDELKLYKFTVEKGTPSIISSLMPLILANSEINKGIIEAEQLFKEIRKKLNYGNKAGITLLAYYIFLLLDEAPEFTDLNLVDSTKEAEVAFQKSKIRLILESITIEKLIVELLEETDVDFSIKLLSSLKETEVYEEDYLELMAGYFQKVSLFQTGYRPYNDILNIQDVFKLAPSQKGTTGIIGDFVVLEKDEDSKVTRIVISAKMGKLQLESKKP